MNGNHLWSTYWANGTFSYLKCSFMVLTVILLPSIYFTASSTCDSETWYMKTTTKPMSRAPGYKSLHLPLCLPKSWEIKKTVISKISSNPYSSVMEWPFCSLFSRWANWTQKMKGLEQSPRRKSWTCLKLPGPPSARAGRRHSVTSWDEGQERGKAGAETLSMVLPNLCILLQPCTAGVLSVAPPSHGREKGALKNLWTT